VCVRKVTTQPSCALALQYPNSRNPLATSTFCFQSRLVLNHLFFVIKFTSAIHMSVCVPKGHNFPNMRLLSSFKLEITSQCTHEVLHQPLAALCMFITGSCPLAKHDLSPASRFTQSCTSAELWYIILPIPPSSFLQRHVSKNRNADSRSQCLHFSENPSVSSLL
jgi:hypothetical protein